jgi:hypothetical protein
MKRFVAILALFAAGCGCGPGHDPKVVPFGAKDLMKPVASSRDANGMLLNPRWQCQETNTCVPTPPLPDANSICDARPVPEACVVKHEIDEARKPSVCYFCKEQNIHGHVNLDYATVAGAGYWANHNDDFDNEFTLTRGNDLLTDHDRVVAIEFASYETFGSVDTLTPLWRRFHDLGIQSTPANNEAIRAMLAPPSETSPNLSVTGLLGLDCEHSCHSELHPVYGLAALTAGGTPTNQTWMLFARNWGNEGTCAQKPHDLARDEVRVLIPNARATNAEVTASLFRSTDPNASAPRFLFVPGQGAVVSFPLRDARERDFVEGNVTVHWTQPEAAGPPPTLLDLTRFRAERKSSESEMRKRLGARNAEEVRASVSARLPKRQTVIRALEVVPSLPVLPEITTPRGGLDTAALAPESPFEKALREELCKRLPEDKACKPD